MTPAWYDLLDVDPGASETEIRDAWKSAIADLDPTDRRFRVYNQAAEVLLDARRRAAYDAELAADRDEPADPPPQAAHAAPSVVEETRRTRLRRTPQPEDPASAPAAGRRPVPAWLLAGLTVLTAVLVGVAAWLWQQPSDDDLAEAVRSARGAAERAVGPVLSYDAADLEASRASAVSHLTADYRKKYESFFVGVMEQNAPNTGTKVETEVVRSGVVRANGEERVEVFLFVDQSTTNKQTPQPTVNKLWVTVSMENVDGEWLVDGMKTL